MRITKRVPQYPVIFVYDNEITNSKKPLYKFANHAKLDDDQRASLETDLFLRLTPRGNLFLLTNPLAEGKTESEIEHMFTEETLDVELGGKKLSLDSKFDNTKFFGKDHFSNYVLANYAKIDFSGFRPFLDAMKMTLQVYEKAKTEK